METYQETKCASADCSIHFGPNRPTNSPYCSWCREEIESLNAYPVYERDSGRFIGNFTRKAIKSIGFKSDNFLIHYEK